MAPLNLRVARFVAREVGADVDFGAKNTYTVSARNTLSLLRGVEALSSVGFDVNVKETCLGWIGEVAR